MYLKNGCFLSSVRSQARAMLFRDLYYAHKYALDSAQTNQGE